MLGIVLCIGQSNNKTALALKETIGLREGDHNNKSSSIKI